MKLALVHDWLDKYGGAERVVTAIDQIFSVDYFFAYADVMDDSDKQKMFNGKKPKIISSKILSPLGKMFRIAFPLFPLIVRTFNKEVKKYQVDLIISSSWSLSKGFKIPNAKHICYLQARNLKYIWEEYDNYFSGGVGKALDPMRKGMQKFDKKMAQNPDFLISNSKYVQDWVKVHYRRDSVVIYPPVDISKFSLRTQPIQESDYYVTVGRLVPYKRFDLIINAFKTLNIKLVIIGDGVEKEKLKTLAFNHSNIEFTGFLTSDKINEYIIKARAFVFTSLEDFGIAPVEAQACGTPVIAYGKGGALETIVEKQTGIFFHEQTELSVINAIKTFESQIDCFDKFVIRSNAERFNKDIFAQKLKDFVAEHIK